MKALKIILVIVTVLVAIFLVGGLLLSGTFTVSRSININASDSVIFHNVANYQNFMKWNPWYKMEPSAKIDISGSPGKPGHQYKWEGKDLGTGQMTITDVRPYRTINMELKFLKPWESVAGTDFKIEPTAEGFTVSWIMSGKYHSTTEKWFGLIMRKMLEDQFESGLQDLKSLSEKK